MPNAAPPHFIIKNRFQKGGLYQDFLTPDILKDICLRVTGRDDYTVYFDDNEYNIGRLAVLEYNERRSYISFSEKEIRGRNSSFQSFPSALSRFILDGFPDKEICFYFHPETTGSFETDYFIFMYRLMRTAGVRLLNIDEHVTKNTVAFTAPEDVIAQKDKLRSKAAGNKSSYVTRGEDGEIQVYAKTYGANKYESTLICIALARISPFGIELYEIEEGGLKSLPAISKQAILASGAVTLETSTNEIEIAEFIQNDSLRSIKFIYNLLEKFGQKRCAFCECEIPQIIQGAHIWPVAAIKQEPGLSLEEKLGFALDGHNGLWLCENHHKLLDSGTLFLAESGAVKYKGVLGNSDVAFVKKITTVSSLSQNCLHADFVTYVGKRNVGFLEAAYSDLT